jgi:tRNA (cmo5U34)-methyltransferase
MTEKDELFKESIENGAFEFDEKVAGVFDDMLNRSVPLYKETRQMAVRLALNFIKPYTRVFDIGCSTANLLIDLSNKLNESSIEMIGIDNSPWMLEKAKHKIKEESQHNIELRLNDISENLEIDNASVVFMNYTLQFVRPLQRESLVRRIYEGLNDDGCFILVEKVLGNNSMFNRFYVEIYSEFKKSQGYSDKEINQKREALENVLVPYRLDENTDLLNRCGFETVDLFFKWYNFAGFIAVK